MRYETEGMASIRNYLTNHPEYDISDEEVDTFKKVLTVLEKRDFKLKGPRI